MASQNSREFSQCRVEEYTENWTKSPTDEGSSRLWRVGGDQSEAQSAGKLSWRNNKGLMLCFDCQI